MRSEPASPTPGWTLSPTRQSSSVGGEVERLTRELVAAKREVKDEVERLTLQLVEARMSVATSEYEKEQTKARARRAEDELEALCSKVLPLLAPNEARIVRASFGAIGNVKLTWWRAAEF